MSGKDLTQMVTLPCVNENREAPRKATVDPELVEAAMIAGFDGEKILKSSQATARMLLLNSLHCISTCSGHTAGSKGLSLSPAGEVGRVAVERLLFSSLPKDLIEIVNVQHVAQPDATNDFLRLLAVKASSNVDVRFRMGERTSKTTSLAGRAHQLASHSAEEHDEQHMFLVLVIADQHGSFKEREALLNCMVTYRLSDHGKSLAHDARQKQFEEALGLASERADMLAEEEATTK